MAPLPSLPCPLQLLPDFPNPEPEECNFTHPYLLNRPSFFPFPFANLHIGKGCTRYKDAFWCCLGCGPLLQTTISNILSYYGADRLFFFGEFIHHSSIHSVIIIANCPTTRENESRKPWCSRRNPGSNPSSDTCQLGSPEQAASEPGLLHL